MIKLGVLEGTNSGHLRSKVMSNKKLLQSASKHGKNKLKSYQDQTLHLNIKMSQRDHYHNTNLESVKFHFFDFHLHFLCNSLAKIATFNGVIGHIGKMRFQKLYKYWLHPFCYKSSEQQEEKS